MNPAREHILPKYLIISLQRKRYGRKQVSMIIGLIQIANAIGLGRKLERRKEIFKRKKKVKRLDVNNFVLQN